MSGTERQQLPKHILKDKDRHGNTRYYFRRAGKPMVRLRAEPGTPEFMEQYDAATRHLPPPEKAVVYFFKQGRRVKIGFSNRPLRRLREMMSGAPKRIEYIYSTPGGRQLERELHLHFSEYRTHGEWFIWNAEIRDWIDADQRRRFDEAKAKLAASTVARCDTPEKSP